VQRNRDGWVRERREPIARALTETVTDTALTDATFDIDGGQQFVP
jgi:hypothetical protein